MIEFRFPTVEVFATINGALCVFKKGFRFPTVEVFATMFNTCQIDNLPFRFPTVEVFATIMEPVGLVRLKVSVPHR